MKGAHTIHHYLQVELLTPHYYRASCRDNGQRLWDYTLSAAQLQHWLLPASRLIQTSPDPLCGIYTLPQGAPWTLSLQDNIEVIEREPITPFKEETFE